MNRILSKLLKLNRKIIGIEGLDRQLKEIKQLQKKLSVCLAYQSELAALKQNKEGISSSYREHSSKVVYVLGSGASLLDFSDAEKKAIQSSRVIAMNRYLLFQDCVGIKPHAVFLGDDSLFAQMTLARLLAHINHAEQNIELFVPEFYKDFPCFNSQNELVFFKRHNSYDIKPTWAETLEDFMYFYRGSLTCLLNLIYVLGDVEQIILCGIDLNESPYFYQKHLENSPQNEDWIVSNSHVPKDTSVHLTASAVEGVKQTSIFDAFPSIIENLSRKNITLSCASKNSELVKRGLCAHTNVQDISQ